MENHEHSMNSRELRLAAHRSRSDFRQALDLMLSCSYRRQKRALAMQRIQNWDPRKSLDELRTIRLGAGRQTGKSYNIVTAVSHLVCLDEDPPGSPVFYGPAVVILPYRTYKGPLDALWESEGDMAVQDKTPIIAPIPAPGKRPEDGDWLREARGIECISIWVDEATQVEREGLMPKVEEFAATSFPTDQPAVLVKLG